MNPDDDIKQPEPRKYWCSTHNCEADNLTSCMSAWARQGIKGGIMLPCEITTRSLNILAQAVRQKDEIAELQKQVNDIKAPERTRRYDPQPDVDPDAAGKTVMVGFRVASKRFSTCVNILAEAMPAHIDTQALLRKALEVGHGITFGPEEDPLLWFVINQDQMDALARVGASNPTWCQIIGTTEAVELSEDAAAERFKALKENQ